MQSMNSHSHFTPVTLRETGAVLLVSCYELGHQPLGITGPAAHLERAGFAPALMDLAVEPFDEDRVSKAALIGISVPMHTALRLGIEAARRVRQVNPGAHIVFFGVYAALHAEFLRSAVADTCLGPDCEGPLVDIARALGAPSPARAEPALPSTGRTPVSSLTPSRRGLPPRSRYVKLLRDGRRLEVGYVAATRGCKHLCRHCPLPPVYHGRFHAVPRDAVMQDIRSLVEDGAQHVTFADPDFLNGPTHAIRVARSLHDAFPDVTFDFTAKIEHLVRQKALLREFRDLGCLFVVSAVESLSDHTLCALAKGHTRRDVVEAVRYFRDIGLTLRPSFVPFTPWDTLENYLDLLTFVEQEDLIDTIDSVQFGIRLLVPPGSLLLSSPEMTPFLGALDPERLTYAWRHPDPRMDELQKRVSTITEDAALAEEDPGRTFFRIRNAAWSTGGMSGETGDAAMETFAEHYRPNRTKPPRLTEDWFC
jgi:radical SAM superfamily enzyme YgiQ (UPF0313 family)